jgi:hypothetical protein
MPDPGASTKGAPSPRRLALPRLAPFQGGSTDDPEGRPLVAPRRHRIIGEKFKKSYIDEKYGVEEAKKKYAEWDKLMQQLFIRRK